MQHNLSAAQFWHRSVTREVFLAVTCAWVLCHMPDNANLYIQHTHWDKLKDVISEFNYTHSQWRTCIPCWEQVGRFINKLLNTTLKQNAFCIIEAMGHCALKSKQSWDNRSTDPEDRFHPLPSQLSNHFIPPFPAGPCWRETIWPWTWPY